MFYFKSNGKYAVAVAGNDDIKRLEVEGCSALAHAATSGDVKAQACLQRLVESNFIPEGNY